MYNLLVTADGSAWEDQRQTYTYQSARFLEYTDDALQAQFKGLRPETIAQLCTIPTLFAHESHVNKPARIGRITNINQNGSMVQLTFQMDPKMSPISRDALLEMQPELGIVDPYELSRTHWAIKNVDLKKAIQLIHSYVKKYRVLPDANRVALKAVRAILDAAETFEVSIEGVKIQVDPNRSLAEPWPGIAWGLDEQQDAPWPPSRLFDCSWKGGKTQIVMSARPAGGEPSGLVSTTIYSYPYPQQLVWINIAAKLREGTEQEIRFGASYSLAKHKSNDLEKGKHRAQRSAAVKLLVRRSGLDLRSDAEAAAFSVALPEGRVGPSPVIALRRLIHLALLKLPFWVKDQTKVIDGVPYIDPDNVRGSSVDVERAAAELDVIQEETASEAEHDEADEPPVDAGEREGAADSSFDTVLARAEVLARLDHDERVDVVHLLGALVAEPNNSANRILLENRIDWPAFCELAQRQRWPEWTDGFAVSVGRTPELTGAADEVLAMAQAMPRRRGGDRERTRDILFAALTQRGIPIVDALLETGILGKYVGDEGTTRLYVKRTSEPWRLPVEAFTLPASPGHEPSGELWTALLRAAGEHREELAAAFRVETAVPDGFTVVRLPEATRDIVVPGIAFAAPMDESPAEAAVAVAAQAAEEGLASVAILFVGPDREAVINKTFSALHAAAMDGASGRRGSVMGARC